ncbi:MAG TPA: lamin tail domain-containing protein, partial [Firmicutes bacterium]|nr:lamin tail domain-containing protein [Bacillota bacterium]
HTISVVGVSDSQGNAISTPQQAAAYFTIPRISISEVMYNNRGADIEWIELFNPDAQPVDLSGWYLTDDDEYPAQGEGAVILPPGTVIQPEERLIVNLWNDPNFSLWRMPESIRVIHPVVVLQGALSNSGDNIALFDSAFGGNLVDGSLSVAFPDLSTDGESIEKIDEWFSWGDRETIQYNFRRAEAPLGFETGLNENLETLSDRATPGRPNGLRPATPSTFWQLY